MIISVMLADDTHPCVVNHEADWVDVDTSDGELLVTLRNRDRRVKGWTRYAAGRWVQAQMVEPVDPELVREQGMEAERDRVPGGGGPLTLGNSGPGGVTR